MRSEKKAILLRFLRTVIPQIPAGILYVVDFLKIFTLPIWVIPTLMFVGACFTAIDKLLRDLEIYK